MIDIAIILFCFVLLIAVGLSCGLWEWENMYVDYGEFHVLPFAYFYWDSDEGVSLFRFGWLILALTVRLPSLSDDEDD